MATNNEILVKDKDGTWRVWRDGQWLEAEAPASIPSSTTPVATATPRPTEAIPPLPVVSPSSTSQLLQPSKGVQPAAALPPRVTPPPLAPVSTRPIVPPTPSTDAFVRQIVQTLAIPLPDDIQPRLENAIRLRLKEVRDTVDTREALRRDVQDGGVGLSDDLADAVVQAILEVIPDMHGRGESAGDTVTMVQETVVPPSSATPSVSSLLGETLGRSDSVVASSSAVSSASSLLKEHEAPLQKSFASEHNAPPEKPAPTPSVVPPSGVVSTPPLIHRPSMVDVRSRPQVVGPVDELRLFSAVDFRRLDADPSRAAARLREKVKLLEDESYDKMVEGVRAWRLSPLHGLYLALGQESLSRGVAIKDVIADRKQSGKETLSEAEFDAVMELNRTLRF